ncbi:MAG: glutaminyl-peptide cyclotransferase [Niabella sp.]|nr:glutaminyl-peptide cyclotransferase [Niabella sp.]
MTKRFYPVLILAAAFAASCNNNGNNDSTTPETEAPKVNTVKNIGYSIIKTYPHDTTSYTQGLVVYKGKMYEGTGGDDSSVVSSKLSRLMETDVTTGKALKSLDIGKKYFGEGITILNDTIYQLTWTEHTVFVYDMNFKKINQFSINTEGWGLTNNGKELIASDGTSNLYFYDPHNFQLLRTQSVTMNGDLINSINELEYIDGFVYANLYTTPYIVKIDPASGQVVGRIDVTQIWNHIKQIDPAADEASGNVPNGIAYDPDTKKIYITGKKWPELYEVQFGN